MLWRIDPERDEPVYQQLIAQVHRAVLRGDLAVGERLPAATELARSLDVNIHTVLHAYRQLREEGVLDVRRGRGAVVVGRRDRGDVVKALRGFASAARDAGLSADAAAALVREEMAS
ncbi:MAG: GntR family transcriptional regulator [Propionibacteriaceae bacterium]|jgi:GntR family transcriptional regulator|nr:GntR family transcriptional regulator [Propionibacteriaceae bacterium]